MTLLVKNHHYRNKTMKYTDEIIKILSINNFNELCEEEIDIAELVQLYDPVLKIFEAEHPVNTYIYP